jgi:phosphoglycerol transferase MdoB-like AlkP superfamily enzyme
MELEDLKNTWKQGPKKEQKTTNIMEMIHQRSRGPLASLKKQFKRGLIFTPILILLLIVESVTIVDSIPGRILVLLVIIAIVAALPGMYYNYQLISKMEATPMPVIENLKEYIGILERRIRKGFVVQMLFTLLLIVLVEVLPLFYHDSQDLNQLHAHHPLVRFAIYIFGAGYLYFICRWSYRRNFARKIKPLKELLDTMK